MRRFLFLIGIGFLCLSTAEAKKPWLEVESEHWTLEQSEKILWDSPWVRWKEFKFYGRHGIPVRANFFVRIQSADPVRLAVAKVVQFQPGKNIRYAGPISEKETKSIAENLAIPDEFLIAVIGVPSIFHLELNRQSLRTISENTILTVDDEEKIELKAYHPPNNTPFGEAWFRFPRPEIDAQTRKIRFSTVFGIPHKVELAVEFKVKDLYFEGDLSY